MRVASLSPLSRGPRLFSQTFPPRQRRCLLTFASPTTSSSSGLPNAPPSTSIARISPPLPKPLNRIPQYAMKADFSLFAKRAPRPFPPPFNSPPASSFSEAHSAYHLSRIPTPEGATFLRGITNGDDAIVYTPSYLGVADGVGAWNTKVAGHAALWSRLMLHFFSLEIESLKSRDLPIDIVECLQRSYNRTISATTKNGKCAWQGTTTACVSNLFGNILTVANVGDSRAYVFRPSSGDFVFKTSEQWHWFDCPRQLGTNSPDTPVADAAVSKVELEEGDIIIMATDGLPDNLWDGEIADICAEGTNNLADRLVEAAKKVAIDPFAESPYMERGIDEGLSMEGGKYDDISVVTAVFRSRR